MCTRLNTLRGGWWDKHFHKWGNSKVFCHHTHGILGHIRGEENLNTLDVSSYQQSILLNGQGLKYTYLAMSQPIENNSKDIRITVNSVKLKIKPGPGWTLNLDPDHNINKKKSQLQGEKIYLLLPIIALRRQSCRLHCCLWSKHPFKNKSFIVKFQADFSENTTWTHPVQGCQYAAAYLASIEPRVALRNTESLNRCFDKKKNTLLTPRKDRRWELSGRSPLFYPPPWDFKRLYKILWSSQNHGGRLLMSNLDLRCVYKVNWLWAFQKQLYL